MWGLQEIPLNNNSKLLVLLNVICYKLSVLIKGSSYNGSTPHLQCGGNRFESGRVHHFRFAEEVASGVWPPAVGFAQKIQGGFDFPTKNSAERRVGSSLGAAKEHH